jgi:hypothetical protein
VGGGRLRGEAKVQGEKIRDRNPIYQPITKSLKIFSPFLVIY